MPRTSDDIVFAVRNAGVVGGGGGGFPTYVKLQAKNVDTVIINGSECEPLLWTDKTLMKMAPEKMIDGLKLIMQATGAKHGVIAVKAHYADVVSAIQAAIPAGDTSIRVHGLHNYYPAGDEFLTVYDVTGRVIPEGGIPLHVGVVVSNSLSATQVYEAVHGKPVTERILTVAGDVREPKVLTVPVGTRYDELIAMCGGSELKDYVVIDGGPMMGNIVSDLTSGIGKTTSGIIVLPKDHFIVRMKTKTLQQMVKLSKAACCQCSRCTDLCPRNLLGHELYPHMTMRTIDYNLSEPAKHITSAFLCSQCGMCEMVACDFMLLSPKKIYAEYRKLLSAKGITNPHKRSGFEVNSQYANRQVSIPMLIKKLGLSPYYRHADYAGERSTTMVRIPIKRHIGAPALPSVGLGTMVRMGDVIAKTPDDKLGSVYHASIHGTVTDITDSTIEISGGQR